MTIVKHAYQHSMGHFRDESFQSITPVLTTKQGQPREKNMEKQHK